MITVSKKNEVYLKIDTHPSTEQELSDFFTFEVPGARFMPLYKNRMWDGKVRLFSQYTKELYLGLLPYVKEFANTLEYDLQINIPDLGEKVNVESFTKLLKLQSGGKDIQIRDYQIDAVRHALRHSRTRPTYPRSCLEASWQFSRKIKLLRKSRLFGVTKNLSSLVTFSKTHRQTQRVHSWISLGLKKLKKYSHVKRIHGF